MPQFCSFPLYHSVSSAFSSVNPTPTIFADLPDCPLPGMSTIPTDILCTYLCPDLVIIFLSRKIIILQFTVPFESNISDARSRKTDRYSPLISDLKSSGYFPQLFTLEVGSCDFISPTNFDALSSIFPPRSAINLRHLRSDLAHIATICSFSIVHAHSEPSWSSPNLLSTR